MKLYISVPSNRDWKGKFGSALAALLSHIKSPPFKMESYTMRAWGQSSCLSIVRQAFVDEMIANEFTHWLSLDDDMNFPHDIVDRLLIHDKEVVAVNARHKMPTVQGSLIGLHGSNIDSRNKTGLEEIKAMGGAIFLAKIDCFKNIPKPHFQVIWSPYHNTYVSEDIHFAALLRANGVKLYCDHDVSQEIGHIGDHEYRWENA